MNGDLMRNTPHKYERSFDFAQDDTVRVLSRAGELPPIRMTIDSQTPVKKLHIALLSSVVLVLAWSGYRPYDRLTWCLETVLYSHPR